MLNVWHTIYLLSLTTMSLTPMMKIHFFFKIFVPLFTTLPFIHLLHFFAISFILEKQNKAILLLDFFAISFHWKQNRAQNHDAIFFLFCCNKNLLCSSRWQWRDFNQWCLTWQCQLECRLQVEVCKKWSMSDLSSQRPGYGLTLLYGT